jgi:hypothetical protein
MFEILVQLWCVSWSDPSPAHRRAYLVTGTAVLGLDLTLTVTASSGTHRPVGRTITATGTTDQSGGQFMTVEAGEFTSHLQSASRPVAAFFAALGWGPRGGPVFLTALAEPSPHRHGGSGRSSVRAISGGRSQHVARNGGGRRL